MRKVMPSGSAASALGPPAQRPAACPIDATLRLGRSLAEVSLGELRGRVVLLSFWSASGVHCARHLEELGRVASRFSEGVSVIAVHTPKFERERDPRLAIMAATRLELPHTLLHDPDFVLWQHYGVSAWPTLVLIDAAGRVAACVRGDDRESLLMELVQTLLDEAAASGARAFEVADPQVWPAAATALCFPQRLLLTRDRLFVADSGHHRVLECTLEGRIVRRFGSGERNLRDGPAHEAAFARPYGMALVHGSLYVADSGNHAIRRIALARGEVETVSASVLDSGPARYRCPTDLAFTDAHDALYVTMAGNHQLWRLRLADGDMRPLAGSGHLGCADGAPRVATLAQPSGIAACRGALYVTDADASALRRLDLDGPGQVQTLVGTGIFEFGRGDGDRERARMQFPQGLCADTTRSRLYLADTYNDALRVFDIEAGTLSTLACDWPLCLPTGVAMANGALWVANSGANEVIRVDPLRGVAVRVAVGE